MAGFVLLVDDDDAIRIVMQFALEQDGYTVHVANGAEEALAWERTHSDPIDVMISDVYMPDVTGVELALEMRRRRPDQRILLISGLADTLPASLQDDRVIWLFKPFSATDLLASLKKFLATG